MMPRHLVEALIRTHNWEPYIDSHWMDFGSSRGGVIITFKGHTQHKFKCSHKVASEILAMGKEVKP